MSHRVTIAELADPSLAPEERIATLPDLERPWEDHLMVTLEVEDDEPLGALLQRAGEGLDQMGPLGGRPEPWVPSYLGIHVDGERVKLWHELTLIDHRGQIRWTWNWKEESYGELLRATAAGAMPGDPARLYFVRLGGAGDGMVSGFPEFIELFSVYWDVVKTYLDVVGYAATAAWLLGFDETVEAGEAATRVAEKKADDWKASGGLPYKIKELVRRPQGWEPTDLARLLGVSEADAIALLAAFGCKEGGEGRWQPGEDAASKLIADSAELVLASAKLDRDAFRAEMRRRFEEFAESGKAPEPDHGSLSALPLDPHWSANANRYEEEEVEGYRSPSLYTRIRRWLRGRMHK